MILFVQSTHKEKLNLKIQVEYTIICMYIGLYTGWTTEESVFDFRQTKFVPSLKRSELLWDSPALNAMGKKGLFI
jgi:hypothetical protein